MPIVKIKPLSQFKAFWEKHRYKIAVSGRASGKSVQAQDAGLTFMLKYPIKILQARQYMNSIADSSHQQVVDRIDELGLEDLFEVQKNRIVCYQTGAEMIFKGLERNITSIKSMANIDITIVEEAESVSSESWNILIPTIMRNDGAELWVLFNPKLPTDATAELFLGEHPPEDMVLMRANYEQNPYLPDSMLKDINHMKEHDYKRYLHVYEGQFEDVGDVKMFPYEIIKRATNAEYTFEESVKIGALDVARFGDDRSVLITREGQKVNLPKSWQGLDLVTLCDNVANEIVIHGIKKLVIDGVGVGAGVVDILRDKISGVCDIVEFNGAYKADDFHFINARAETYSLAKDWLIEGGSLPNHPDLIKEMASIEYKYNNKEQLQLESKADLKKRIGVSPDFCDAFTMLFFKRASEAQLDLKTLMGRDNSW